MADDTAQNLVARIATLWEARGLLYSLHADLTYACPLRCAHCYIGETRGVENELSTDEWLSVLDEAAGMKTLVLVISGGEPMTRRDFWALVEAARTRWFRVRIKTTGLYLDRDSAVRMAAMGNVTVDVSIHGAKAETHDAFVGVRGAHRRATAAIGALREAGVAARVTMSALGSNISEAAEVRRMYAGMGVGCEISPTVLDPWDGRDVSTLAAPARERARLVASRAGGGARSFSRGSLGDEPICRAGRTHLYVGPGGEITPCVSWPQRIGSIREGGLRAAWASPEAVAIRGLRACTRQGCGACELLPYCSFCPGQSWLESRDPTAPNRPACEDAAAARDAAALVRD